MSLIPLSPSGAEKCPNCGAPVPEQAPQGLCPKCLFVGLAVSTEDGAGAAAQAPPQTLEELAPHFPQLEILEYLGRGGMGVVYKARQKSLNRFVALKLLAPERVADAKFAQRFTHEAQALATLNHPSIVTIYDFGQAGGFYFLLMEFVDGVNLRQAMKAGRFTPEQALSVVPPVCEALQYAHDHGIVHRDIKPENLLLDKEGRVKIADFGIAKMLGADTTAASPQQPQGAESEGMLASAAGTPQYMAPEQKAHQATDHRADIYSLGVVLYEMLTGELPTDKLQPPSRKVQVDVRLDEIVLRALELKPELRYQTAGEFRTQVENVVSTQRGSRREADQTSGISPRVLNASPCYVSTPEQLGTFAGQFFLYRRKSQVILDDRHLIFTRAGTTTIIPLAAIQDLSIGYYPRVMNPAGLDFISMTYDEGGQIRRLFFSPSEGLFGLPSRFNQFVADWFDAIRDAVTSATGRVPGHPPAKQLGVPSGSKTIFAILLALFAPAFGMLMFIAIRRQEPHAPTTFPFNINPLWVVLALAGVVLVAMTVFGRRIRRGDIPGGVASGGTSLPSPSNTPRSIIACCIAYSSALFAAATWVQMPYPPLSLLFGIPITALLGMLLAVGVHRTSCGKQALWFGGIQTGVWGAVWLLFAVVIPQRNPISGPEIERVQVSNDQAIVKARGSNDAGMIFIFGTDANRWTPGGLYLETMFDVTLGWSRFERGARWTIKTRHGIYWHYRLDGPPGPMLGKIVFQPGTPSPQADGSYVIGEFRPDNGKPLPISVSLERTRSEARPAQAVTAVRPATIDAKPTFDPVRERVLPSDVPCREQLFQFRSGKVFVVGNGPGTSKEEAAFDEQKIDAAGGVDMAAISGDGGIQIAGRGCVFTQDVAELNWDSFTAEQVVHAIQRASFVDGVVEPKKNEFPITYLFKTARGEVGVMEVMGVVDLPRDGWIEKGMKFRYKLVQGTGTATTAALTKSSLVFGPETRGLQAAIDVTPGEPFKLRIHVRNISDRGISIGGALYRQDDECLLTDAQGQPVPVTKVTHDIKIGMKGGYFSPGQVAVFECAGLSFQDIDKVPASAGYVAKASPGRYTLRFRLRLPGDDVPFATGDRDWKGELETGPVTIDVKEPVAPIADSPSSAILGPVVERVVNDLQTTRENCALSFDSGKFLPVPANIMLDTLTNPSAQPVALAWARDNQVDAVAFVTTDAGKIVKCGLLCPRLVVLRATNPEWVWDSPTPRELKEEFDKAMHEWKELPHIAEVTTGDDFPANYMILDTRTRRRGVLQIIGVTDNPRGVKIRYRLVEGAPVKKG